jgi:hypothetical protein
MGTKDATKKRVELLLEIPPTIHEMTPYMYEGKKKIKKNKRRGRR